MTLEQILSLLLLRLSCIVASAAVPDDYYELLGLRRQEADADSIRRAYRQQALRWHPDKCSDPSRKQEFEGRFKAISEAYQVLTDPAKKDAYDRFGKNAVPGQGQFPGSDGFRGFESFFSGGDGFSSFRGGGDFFETFFTNPFEMFNRAFGDQNPFEQMRNMRARNPEMNEDEMIRQAVEQSLQDQREDTIQPRSMSDDQALQEALKASQDEQDVRASKEEYDLKRAMEASLSDTRHAAGTHLSAWKQRGTKAEYFILGPISLASFVIALISYTKFRNSQKNLWKVQHSLLHA